MKFLLVNIVYCILSVVEASGSHFSRYKQYTNSCYRSEISFSFYPIQQFSSNHFWAYFNSILFAVQSKRKVAIVVSKVGLNNRLLLILVVTMLLLFVITSCHCRPIIEVPKHLSLTGLSKEWGIAFMREFLWAVDRKLGDILDRYHSGGRDNITQKIGSNQKLAQKYHKKIVESESNFSSSRFTESKNYYLFSSVFLQYSYSFNSFTRETKSQP